MKITYEMLCARHACRDQRNLFELVFPEGAELSKENWQKAIDAGLEVEWLSRFLSDPAGRAFDTVCDRIEAELDAACAPLLREFDRRWDGIQREWEEGKLSAEARDAGWFACNRMINEGLRPLRARAAQQRTDALFTLLVQTFAEPERKVS